MHSGVSPRCAQCASLVHATHAPWASHVEALSSVHSILDWHCTQASAAASQNSGGSHMISSQDGSLQASGSSVASGRFVSGRFVSGRFVSGRLASGADASGRLVSMMPPTQVKSTHCPLEQPSSSTHSVVPTSRASPPRHADSTPPKNRMHSNLKIFIHSEDRNF